MQLVQNVKAGNGSPMKLIKHVFLRFMQCAVVIVDCTVNEIIIVVKKI